jgi:hypothetical protein
MKLETIFTAEELALIDSGEYKPGRAVLDAKLDLVAAIEREACANICETLELPEWPDKVRQPLAQAIRTRGQA